MSFPGSYYMLGRLHGQIQGKPLYVPTCDPPHPGYHRARLVGQIQGKPLYVTAECKTNTGGAGYLPIGYYEARLVGQTQGKPLYVLTCCGSAGSSGSPAGSESLSAASASSASAASSVSASSVSAASEALGSSASASSASSVSSGSLSGPLSGAGSQSGAGSGSSGTTGECCLQPVPETLYLVVPDVGVVVEITFIGCTLTGNIYTCCWKGSRLMPDCGYVVYFKVCCSYTVNGDGSITRDGFFSLYLSCDDIIYVLCATALDTSTCGPPVNAHYYGNCTPGGLGPADCLANCGPYPNIELIE